MKSVKERLKPLVQGVFPNAYSFLQRQFGNSGSPDRVAGHLIAHFGRCVQHGPFAGMKYVDQAVCSCYAPKLVGCYEAELHDVLERAITGDYSTLIDVGCAEGYYAVGLACRLPNKKVYAFDLDPRARELCTEMAKLNGVGDQVIVGAACNTEVLSALTLSAHLSSAIAKAMNWSFFVPRLFLE